MGLPSEYTFELQQLYGNQLTPVWPDSTVSTMRIIKNWCLLLGTILTSSPIQNYWPEWQARRNLPRVAVAFGNQHKIFLSPEQDVRADTTGSRSEHLSCCIPSRTAHHNDRIRGRSVNLCFAFKTIYATFWPLSPDFSL